MPSRASALPIARQGSDQQQEQQRHTQPAFQPSQHPSTPAYPYRYPPPPGHNHHESDPTSPLTNSFGGSPGRQSQANSPPDQHHPQHYQQHHPVSHPGAPEVNYHYQTTYVSRSTPAGYTSAMPMYSGHSGGAAAAPYPGAGGFHAAHPSHGLTRGGGPPTQGYIMQPMGYVVAGPPAGSAPPPGYTMAYATTTSTGATVAPARSTGDTHESGASLRNSPASMPLHHAPYHHGHERTPAGGAGVYAEHPIYRPASGASHRPPPERNPEEHPERASPYHATAPHPRGYAHSPQHHHPPPSHHMAANPHYPTHHPRTHSMADPSRLPVKEEEASVQVHSHSDLLDMDKRTAEEVQAERDRQAAEYELSLARVKPIRSDFAWFAQDAAHNGRESVPKNIEDDVFLKNSYLNGRLKHVWENMEQDERLEFLKREEADRRRFTEEEEVASRHCATLTARAPGPSPSKQQGSVGTKDKRASPSSSTYKNMNTEDRGESPTKRNKLDVSPTGETISKAPEPLGNLSSK